MSMAQVAKKQFKSLIKLEFEKKKKRAATTKKRWVGKRAVPGRAISTLPPRRGVGTDGRSFAVKS